MDLDPPPPPDENSWIRAWIISDRLFLNELTINFLICIKTHFHHEEKPHSNQTIHTVAILSEFNFKIFEPRNPGRVAQSVTCLATDACLTADPGVASSIPVRSHTFVEIWPWNDFYGHSPPFRWFIQEGLLSVTSESMCTNYWLTACSSLPRKRCG